jgi:hypothetical protein
MPTGKKNKPEAESSKTSEGITVSRPATRNEIKKTGNLKTPEDLQDIKNAQEGRSFLEKLSLLCPPGEPLTHEALSVCLHQISAMAGLQKQAVNAIRATAFLLEEMEEDAINLVVKEAFDSQISELTLDMKTLIEDAKSKIDEHIKTTLDKLNTENPSPTPPAFLAPVPSPNATTPSPRSYAATLINPPSHANPILAAREGIRARQFLLKGATNSPFGNLESQQLKKKINDIARELGLEGGGIRSAQKQGNGHVLIEVDSDNAARWFANVINRTGICDRLGSTVIFKDRTYRIIALNAPLTMDPDNNRHISEICEVNHLERNIIEDVRWAKPINRRSPNQRSAHLIISTTDPSTANRIITDGLVICNKKCHAERTKREPTRCLKCQGWNHIARDCIRENDKCGNCAGDHRTDTCPNPHATRCVSCGTNDHASWNRRCPTLLKKTEEFNARNPENTLHFFPTTDPWTWTPSNRNPTPAPTTNKEPNQSNHQTYPQWNSRDKGKGKAAMWCTDTYIPDYAMPSNEEIQTVYEHAPRWDSEPMNLAQPVQLSKPPSTTITFVNNNRNAEAGPSKINLNV